MKKTSQIEQKGTHVFCSTLGRHVTRDTPLFTICLSRFFASEIIREALFENLQKELPYCCEVRIAEFKEPKASDSKQIIKIKAIVFVEKESQKVILIGKGGMQIKKIGIMAREKLERFLKVKVCCPNIRF